MNKRELILVEAKRLFGQYGYLGFTLKQLAKACSMTSPALYYFYSSKADLFRDCLLSELDARKAVMERCAEGVTTLAEFARKFAYEAIEVCELNHFRTVRAMEEIIHLPQPMQDELRAAGDAMLIAPVETLLDRLLPHAPAAISRRLLASFIIYMATFSAVHDHEFPSDELAELFVAVANGIEHAACQAVRAEAPV